MRCARSIAGVLAAFFLLGGCASVQYFPSTQPLLITLPSGSTGTTLSLSSAGATASVTVGKSGYSGTIDAQSSDTAVATVSPASASASKKRDDSSSSGATFTVTAVGAGNATIDFSATDGSAAQLAVTVTITGGVISVTTRSSDPRA
ncbi:MAG TPA: hypothetical protein VMD47_05845 [Candidatus Acidoferrales bacterium]|nr:hypothetical protein [Candidatus Acidoferrales bacterium]